MHYKIDNLVEGQIWYDYWEIMKEFPSIGETENIFIFLKIVILFNCKEKYHHLYDYSTNNVNYRN